MTKQRHAEKEVPRTPEQLTEADLKEIDAALLENASVNWSKVSRIVLATMIERGDGVTGLPTTFYTERVVGLVQAGSLEARGDLTDMHLSEVRRTASTK
ncbi:hypothetical protein GMLC_17840 [Geomonas limicola]|uniref:DUF3658 domain-containing protein n=1 Tax=Geomonas limicola TaxID=2740186 RepID=A0A6V8N6J4_9BACT|nr:DUF3658 domain-containing protein [Geomonas limicola]GFO68205.1 hypothetical protein GMLC_17840 [Geomonas limicola]